MTSGESAFLPLVYKLGNYNLESAGDCFCCHVERICVGTMPMTDKFSQKTGIDSWTSSYTKKAHSELLLISKVVFPFSLY